MTIIELCPAILAGTNTSPCLIPPQTDVFGMLPREREFEEIIMVEVSIERCRPVMFMTGGATPDRLCEGLFPAGLRG